MKRFPLLFPSTLRQPHRLASWLILPLFCSMLLVSSTAVTAQPRLFVAYPLNNHETTSSKIFLIGTAPKGGAVTVNGQVISRNTAGHFAPSFPLQVGANTFMLRYGNQELRLAVTRTSTTPPVASSLDFVPGSLTPAVAIARQPNEWLCFGAAAPQGATVTVRLGNTQAFPLSPQTRFVELPPNSAVLTAQNQPTTLPVAGFYQGCTRTVLLGNLGQPTFELNIGDQRRQQIGPGNIQILSPTQLEVAEVTAESGTARTGPSTDYSRLTPLPKGTQASITGAEGDWVRLDYGAWVRRSEVQIRKASVPPSSLIRSVKARRVEDWTEVVFPLQVPVPMTVQQGDRTFTLTLHNTTAQTDTIRLDDDPLIARLDWTQPQPGQVQYVFNLKTNQQWGYKLRYEGSSLILSLRHPPNLKGSRNFNTLPANPLTGIKIVLDPGHGGPEDLGARGPTGTPEKDVALKISKLVQQELAKRGATVVMTREKDVDLGLRERMDAIANAQPDIALSLHYNALPDDGDAIKTKGVSTFWYHAQAHSLAVFLHNYLTKTLNRPSAGVFWNNLALTRPTVAPTALLELGFMINPDEYEWIVNPREQQRLAGAIADGVTQWLYSRK
ncbi:MAG: N-acetylmuramoyl-L-alanine amidase [Leptolyngbyaceae cyanobacterium bins.349]|nr:N-acetylmuramoyl-L-alanine amidase [Leptolyngbyaceae cyanobacterium bins.349]